MRYLRFRAAIASSALGELDLRYSPTRLRSSAESVGAESENTPQRGRNVIDVVHHSDGFAGKWHGFFLVTMGSISIFRAGREFVKRPA